MALVGSYTDATGTTHPNAYAKVVTFNDNRIANQAFFVVDIFKDQAARDAGNAPVGTVNNPINNRENVYEDWWSIPDLNQLNVNHISQSYEYMKTLPEWSGWQDD